jgi:hypothetical protein
MPEGTLLVATTPESNWEWHLRKLAEETSFDFAFIALNNVEYLRSTEWSFGFDSSVELVGDFSSNYGKPVITCSWPANDRIYNQRICDAGALAVLPMPFSFEQLKGLVARALKLA